MALIRCMECGKMISDMAKSCVACGCPISMMKKEGAVRIKIPNNVVTGFAGLFSKKKAAIMDDNWEVVWEGRHGDNARFVIDRETEISIDLGGWVNPIHGVVEPYRKYTLVQDKGIHMLATYVLMEVDVIDAG